jgi:hypothetical protein
MHTPRLLVEEILTGNGRGRIIADRQPNLLQRQRRNGDWLNGQCAAGPMHAPMKKA